MKNILQSDYHLHSQFCDGKNTIDEMVASAIDRGLVSIGLSSHFPLKYPCDWTMRFQEIEHYLEEIKAQEEKYGEQVEIYTGMEVDFYLDSLSFHDDFNGILPKLDYYIGSIHTMGCFENGEAADIDYTEAIFSRGIDVLYEGDGLLLAKKYYEGIAEMVSTAAPPILGHLDLIKKNNINYRYFDPESMIYRRSWMDCLDVIRRSDCIVEVNTGGISRWANAQPQKWSDYLYPSVDILKAILDFGIPITVCSDSHQMDTVAFGFDWVVKFLGDLGFRSIYNLKNNIWQDIAF